MEESKMSSDHGGSTKKLVLGTGGTLGVLSLLGACGGACTLAAIPLGSLLGAVGLGGLAVFLPYWRWPLLGLALVFSVQVLRTMLRRGRPLQTVSIALLIGASFAFAGYQAFKATPCEVQAAQASEHLTPELAAVFDPEMAKGCEMGCAAKGEDEKSIVAQPGAKPGDLVRCPVSGVVFKVKSDSPQIEYNGTKYFSCCPTCAARFQKKFKS